MAAPGGGFFSDYYAEQTSETWWGAGPPEDESARPRTGGYLLTPPCGFSGPMNFDPLKQAPQIIAEHRVDWPSTWQEFPTYLVEQRNDTRASIHTHLQRDRQDRWNALHLSSSDTESSPGSPVSAPTFFEPESADLPSTDFGRGAPQPFATQDGSMMPFVMQGCSKMTAAQTGPPVQAAPPPPPVITVSQPVMTAAQKEALPPPMKSGRPAAEPVHPQKKRRKMSAPKAQAASRRSARAPMPLVRPDFAQFAETTSDEDEREELDGQISADHTTDTDGEEQTADSADENDSCAASHPAASATSTSAGAVDLDAFPPDVKRCLLASRTRMLEWSEAATILRYHVQIKRQEQQGPFLPTRPLCLVGGKNGSQTGGIYVEMPKIPRPRHRCKSAKARAKLTQAQKELAAQQILPDRWRNSGGSKGSSDLPKEAKPPAVRRRYGAVLPAVGPFAKQARTKQISSTSGALRYYEYTLLDAGPSGEQCFLFHVVNPACTKHK